MANTSKNNQNEMMVLYKKENGKLRLNLKYIASIYQLPVEIFEKAFTEKCSVNNGIVEIDLMEN